MVSTYRLTLRRCGRTHTRAIKQVIAFLRILQAHRRSCTPRRTGSCERRGRTLHDLRRQASPNQPAALRASPPKTTATITASPLTVVPAVEPIAVSHCDLVHIREQCRGQRIERLPASRKVCQTHRRRLLLLRLRLRIPGCTAVQERPRRVDHMDTPCPLVVHPGEREGGS